MSESHQAICKSLSLAYYKPNEIIYNQGEKGDSFYYILIGTVKQKIQKRIEQSLIPFEKENKRRYTASPEKNPDFGKTKHLLEEAYVEVR
jgi:hypothetical protein